MRTFRAEVPWQTTHGAVGAVVFGLFLGCAAAGAVLTRFDHPVLRRWHRGAALAALAGWVVQAVLGVVLLLPSR